MKNKKNGGFTYIEVVMAMAILVIIMTPILPALTQAATNHHFALQRRIAQGHASNLALEVRATPNDANNIVNNLAAFDYRFIYRISIIPISGDSTHFTAGNAGIIPTPDIPEPPDSSGFSTYSDFAGMFDDGVFVVAEVFDERGLLAGLSISKSRTH